MQADTAAKSENLTAREWLEIFSSDLVGLGWEEGCKLDVLEDGTILSKLRITPKETQRIPVEGPPTFSLAICFSGKGEFSLSGGEPMSVQPGTALLFHSNKPMAGKNVIFAGKPFEIIDIRYSPPSLSRIGGMPLDRFAHDLVTDHSQPEERATFIGFEAPPALLGEAQKIANCRYAEGPARNLFLYGAALQCLALTFDYMSQPYAHGVALSNSDQRKVLQAIELLETDYHRQWTIAKLSAAVGLSQKKLKSGFRAKIGKTIGTHLRDVRLDTAERMLQEGKSVTDTALSCGFSNLSHFSKLFKAYKGVLPSKCSSVVPD